MPTPNLGFGRRRHQRRTEQTLQVDRQVESAASQRTEQAGRRGNPEEIRRTGGSIVHDQLVNVAMTTKDVLKRLTDNPGKWEDDQRSRKAAKIGKAWMTSPSELGLMMQMREGSSRSSRRGELVMAGIRSLVVSG